MPSFKAAYLIHGDDHGRIGERRARLRAMAEAESGQNGVELFEAEACTADAVAAALSAMTFAIGRRFVIADGVERWKEADVAPVAAAVKSHGPGDAHGRVLRARGGPLQGAGRAAQGGRGGRRRDRRRDGAEGTRAAALARRPGRELGVELDDQGARALVAQVGERRQRLLREIEKLALEYGAGARIGVAEVEASCASSAERRTWTLADALVAGDEKTATRALLELRQQGERIPSLLYQMVRRVRDALAIAEALAAGQPASQVRRRPADAVVRRRPADRRRLDPRSRGLPARARAARRPRGREPGRRSGC